MSKFLPGNNANPNGRPKSLYKEDFDSLVAKKKMFSEGLQIYQENHADIIQAMCEIAKKGNVQAAQYLRDTYIGKPKEVIEHDMTEEAKKGLSLAYKLGD